MPRSFLYAFVVLSVPGVSDAQVIDFETLPGGAPTADLQDISTEYAVFGVTFALLDRNTGVPIGFPKIAKVREPLTAFEGCEDADTPKPNLDLGSSFLTDGTSLGVSGDVRIEYATPVAQASGVILDIDCRINGGPPCEQWTITAYDSAGVALQTAVLDGPPGAPNPQCLSPGNGPGDGEAFGWVLDTGSANISSIVLEYTGQASNVGLAFDNFSPASLPGPPVVAVSSPADSVCSGESLELAAMASAGIPPYGYQWQEEAAPSVWADLGTAATETVVPGPGSRYRVVLTDSQAQQSVSAPVEPAVLPGTLAPCLDGVLVSDYLDHRVVRSSIFSQQPQVLVDAGSGGLNGTSDLVCHSDGSIYVVSQQNDRVIRYDGATGAFIDVFVAGGSGGLDIPIGIDFGPDGNLYVVSSSNHSVIRYDGVTGTHIDTFIPTGSGLNSPSGMLWGTDDNLYVCSRDGDKVLRFDSSGSFVDDFVAAGSGGLDAPRGLTFGPDGHLYVAEEIRDAVSRFDGTTGDFIDLFVPSGTGGLDRANDVVFGPDGNLYVASYNSNEVLRFDGTTGASLGALGGISFNGPAWVAIGCQFPPVSASIHAGEGSGIRFDAINSPRTGVTALRYELDRAASVRLGVYDVTGRSMTTLVDGARAAGTHVVDWSWTSRGGGDVPSGVYFANLRVVGQRLNESITRKIVVVR